MKLLIVRHADAGDREEWEKSGRPDEERPLSPKGMEQMRGAARGLLALVPDIDVIVASPLVRAVQTAEILLAAYAGKPTLETHASLEPEVGPEKFRVWLRDHDELGVIAAVGHEPHLGILTTWLMTGEKGSRVEMKKGGACLLEFEKKIRAGSAILSWLMAPKQLSASGSAR